MRGESAVRRRRPRGPLQSGVDGDRSLEGVAHGRRPQDVLVERREGVRGRVGVDADHDVDVREARVALLEAEEHGQVDAAGQVQLQSAEA